MIVVIHGPPASGKTLNAERFRAHYDCETVIDGWMEDGIPSAPHDGALVLTNAPESAVRRHLPRARIVAIDTAMHDAGGRRPKRDRRAAA